MESIAVLAASSPGRGAAPADSRASAFFSRRLNKNRAFRAPANRIAPANGLYGVRNFLCSCINWQKTSYPRRYILQEIGFLLGSSQQQDLQSRQRHLRPLRPCIPKYQSGRKHHKNLLWLAFEPMLLFSFAFRMHNYFDRSFACQRSRHCSCGARAIPFMAAPCSY